MSSNHKLPTTSKKKSRIRYRIILAMRNGKPTLTGKTSEHLDHVVHEIAKEYFFQIIKCKIYPDHIEVIVKANPKIAPYSIAEALKNESAKKMMEEYGDKVFWSKGHFIGTTE